MANKIILKKSSVANRIPLTTDLDYGELALNYADGKLYYKTSDGTTIDSFQAGSGVSSKRVVILADSPSITLNADTTDLARQTNTQILGTLTFNAPTGTPTDGQQIIVRITSINAHALSWNAVFRGSTDLQLPTTLSGASKEDYFGFSYDDISSKWDLIAKNFGF